MAEYYPLLAKAVANLKGATPETRRAMYERARRALTTQLRNLDPPAAEADIDRECRALDEAVARLEAEFITAGDETAPATSLGAGDAAPSLPSAGPVESSPADQKTAKPDRPGAPGTAGRPWLPPRTVRLDESGSRSKAGSPDLPKVTTELPRVEEPPRPAEPPPPAGSESAEKTEQAKLRAEMQRPFAPQPVEQPVSGRRLWIVGAVVAVIVAAVAVAAWKLRDRPEDLARLKPQASTVPASSGSGKISERVGGGPKTDASAPSSLPPAAPKSQSETKLAIPEPSNPPIPVAYRAALLLEAPDESNKVRTFVGTVIWRLENVTNGPGQPLATAVHADIDIPDDKLRATLTFQKNFDSTLPASHTMKIEFAIQPDSPSGNVKQISVPQMRREEVPTGEGLIGVPVPIMENSFLVGLGRGNFEASNLDLIKNRDWIDVPMLVGNNRVAKMTFEKGASGQRAIEDAIASWQNQ